jgi:hypothetical protein
MKKVIAGLLLGAVLLVNSAYANGNENVNEKVKAAFKQEFVQASEVSWHKADNYYKAEFKMNDDVLTAYFSEDGELMGVIRNLASTELPINLQTSLKKEYSGYWITELFEFARKDASGYFITVENADQVITLQSGDGSNWSTFRKVKKQ